MSATVRERLHQCACPWGALTVGSVGRAVHLSVQRAGETGEGLVLVDTGYGLSDVHHPHPRLSRTFRAMPNIRFGQTNTARYQIEAKGFDPRDVRHIGLTHLDFDHAGGLEDFPEATVHVMKKELDAFRQRAGVVARGRYRPMQIDGVRRKEVCSPANSVRPAPRWARSGAM